jgi:sialate O-acetylesterase
VAYYFGKEILQRENVPIGLVGSYWGGTPAEAWTSSAALKGHPLIKHYLDERDLRVLEMDARMKRYHEKVLPKWERDHKEWETTSRTAGAKSPEPRKPTAPDRNPSTPTVLFNAMIYPLLNYGVKGVIWYQGEANAKTKEKSSEYAQLFPAMIADWRAQWGRGEFPFLFVQLAGYGEGAFFPELREAQAKTLSLSNTGMAVALDAGERGDIHPTNKRIVGERLALVARSVAYGEDVLHEGPTVTCLESGGETLRLHFSKTGGKLVCDGTELRGFEVAGEDEKFTAVPAVIEGEAVVLDRRSVSAPRYIRYGWAPYSEGNLYNAVTLPAAPFVMSVQESGAGVR